MAAKQIIYCLVLPCTLLLHTAAMSAEIPVNHPVLKAPTEIGYDESGLTSGVLRAAENAVMVGNKEYRSLVFNEHYDSPLLRTRPGGVMSIELDNQMDEITNLHFHGMQVSPLDNGDNIFHLIQPYEKWQFDIKLPDDHPPGAYWYHSHFNRGSQRQVSGGIAGPIIVDGMLDPFPELQGITERVLVLRNFQKTFTGKLASDIVTGAPSIRTVNGQAEPVIEIRPGETQLWHFINIASNQYFRIRIAGQTFQVLSRDGNTTTQQVIQDKLLIGPSARFSILVTGPEQGSYDLDMGVGNTGPAGDYYPPARLAIMKSSGSQQIPKVIASAYPEAIDYSNQEVAHTRTFTFQDVPYDGSLFLINGRQFDFDQVNTTVKLGDVEEWVLYNPSQELHQFHIHQTDFQVVAINKKPVAFSGYRDNVYIPATGSITVRIPFTDPVILGKFVYHCHILEHEDGGMMAVIQVVKPEDYAMAVKLEPLGGIYGENQTCAYLQNTDQEERPVDSSTESNL